MFRISGNNQQLSEQTVTLWTEDLRSAALSYHKISIPLIQPKINLWRQYSHNYKRKKKNKTVPWY